MVFSTFSSWKVCRQMSHGPGIFSQQSLASFANKHISKWVISVSHSSVLHKPLLAHLYKCHRVWQCLVWVGGHVGTHWTGGKETRWNVTDSVKIQDSDQNQNLEADTVRTNLYYCTEVESRGHFYSVETWSARCGFPSLFSQSQKLTQSHGRYLWQHISWPVTLILLPWAVTWEISRACTNSHTSYKGRFLEVCVPYIWEFRLDDVNCPCVCHNTLLFSITVGSAFKGILKHDLSNTFVHHRWL